MRIVTLTVKDFRCHAETVLELDRFSFIRGPNDSGKSSLQMALEFLLTGRCALTDAAGRGAETLIRTGTKEFDISARLDGGLIIRRRRGSKSHIVEVNGNRIPVEMAAEYIEKHLAPASVLSSVVNAGSFVEMTEAQQQQLLSGLVGAGRMAIPAEIANALNALGEPAPVLESVAAVNALYARVYEMRSETSRNLKALGETDETEIPADAPSPVEVRKKLEELRQQKEQLIARNAGAAALWQSAQARLQSLRSELAEAGKQILEPHEEAEMVEVVSHRPETEKLRQELAELNHEARSIEGFLSHIKHLDSECPTCGQPFPDEAKRRVVAARQERFDEIEGLIQGVKEELSEYSGVDEAARRLDAHRNAVARRAKLQEAQGQLQALQEPDSETLNSRLTILSERISKVDRILEKAQQAQIARESWEAHHRHKSQLADRAARLEMVVNFFAPTGALIAQASREIESFSNKLNRQLAAFGYTCNICVDPYEVRVGRLGEDGAGLRLNQLSESEQFRFGVAFQLAVAELTGTRLAVIDRADMLDGNKRKLLTSLLLQSSVDQAIVLSTGEAAAPDYVPGGVKFLPLGLSNAPGVSVCQSAAVADATSAM